MQPCTCTSALILLLISSIQCQSEEYYFEYVLDVREDLHGHFWTSTRDDVQLYFYYHADVSQLPRDTQEYLDDAKVLEWLMGTNATGLWAALHGRHPSLNCTTEPPISTPETSETTTDVSSTLVTDTTFSPTTEDPCPKEDFPFIAFSGNHVIPDFTLESFSIVYYTSRNSSLDSSQPQIWLNIYGERDYNSNIPEDCDNLKSSNNWTQCDILGLTEKVTKVEIVFQSEVEYDVILVDKITLGTRGLYTPATTETTGEDSTTESSSDGATLETSSVPDLTPTTPDFSGGSSPTFFNSILFLPLVALLRL